MPGPTLDWCLRRYLHRQREVVADADARTVHDQRVALRRIQAVLAAGRSAYDPDATRRLRHGARGLRRGLGLTRDVEVLEGLLVPRVADPADRALVEEVLADRRARAEAVAATVDAAPLLDALDRFLADPPLAPRGVLPAGRQARRLARKEVRRLAGLVDEAARRPAGEDHWHALHELRKSTKRARYLLEATKPVRKKRRGAKIGELRRLQDVLGDQHDLVVAAGLARDLGAPDPQGDLVRLAGDLEREAAGLEPAYRAAWAAVRDRAVSAGWL